MFPHSWYLITIFIIIIVIGMRLLDIRPAIKGAKQDAVYREEWGGA